MPKPFLKYQKEVRQFFIQFEHIQFLIKIIFFSIISKKTINKENMLKIKSLQKNTIRIQINDIKQKTHQQNFQLQCNIPTLVHHSLLENVKVSKDKKMAQIAKKRSRAFRIMKIKTSSRISCLSEYQLQQKSIYDNVNVINVNEDQDKIYKLLWAIGLGKTYDNIGKNVIKDKFVTFWKVNQLYDNEEDRKQQVKISMQGLYRHYLQYKQEELKKSIFEGNINKKIIKPFLSMYKKIKMQTPVITDKYVNYLRPRCHKNVMKADIFRVFQIYKPKVLLNEQIKKMQQKGQQMYQQLYLKYENIPFYDDEQTQAQPKQDQINQNPDDDPVQFPSTEPPQNPNTSNKIKTLKLVQYPNLDDARDQILKVGFTQNNIKEEQQQKNQEQNNEHKNQNFQDRFKKQIEKLSEGLNNIISL